MNHSIFNVNTKRLFTVVVLTCMTFTQIVKAWTGSAPASGQKFYLYNLYQEKFLSYGNTSGTQVSLDNSNPLLCTLEGSGSSWKINTHYSLSSKGYKASYSNYIAIASNVPYVNSKYGTSDTSYSSRTEQAFSITQSSDRGYYLTYTSSSTTMALMYGSGTACEVAALSNGSNKSKAEWLFISESEYNTFKAKKRFTAAAMNVDGMPKTIKIAGVYNLSLNPDGKESAGATAIGKKLLTMGYDFVGVSEDFNYNSEIVTQIKSVYNQGTHRGKIATSSTAYSRIISKKSPVFDTDGLNFFWNKNKASASNESWVRWNEHYGYTSDGADGLIDKGYRFYTVTLSDGTKIDVYTLHMDAEDSQSDNLARESQMTQLANAIKASNNRNPILIMGDTNCRYTRDRIKALLIDAINADSRFTIKDAWIEHARNGIYPSCNGNSIMAGDNGYRKGEVVDKIFYINNTASSVKIQAESYLQDLSFVNDSGEPLADHWPCVVEFSYTANSGSSTTPTEDNDNLDGSYYFRNKETGAFLKQGGWWGTHAVQGNYGSKMTLTELSGGKYVIQSPVGILSQGDPYMDSSSEAQWNVVENGGYYSFTYSNNGTTMALTGNDATTFAYGPNTRYVTCATYNSKDSYQKWELLTADDLRSEMSGASANNPVNVTYLLKGANFDRNDNDGRAAWNNNIASSAKKMWYNLCDGMVDYAYGNPVAEVYCDSYSGTTSYSTVWEINQTISNVPNGKYRVTCQAFYRDGSMNQNNPGTIHSYLYARSGSTESKVKIASMYSAYCTTAYGAGNKDKSGYYIPNSMSDATYFFNAGYYQNSVDINVTNGKLQVAIGKPDKTKSTSGWTCFDNFQIFYLGNSSNAKIRGTETTDIEDIDIQSEKMYFNASGVETKGLQKGMNIIRYSDGKVQKVYK